MQLNHQQVLWLRRGERLGAALNEFIHLGPAAIARLFRRARSAIDALVHHHHGHGPGTGASA